MRKLSFKPLLITAALLSVCTVGWSVDFLTEGVDNARTGFLAGDTSFTVQNVKGMHLLWKTKLDSAPREMHNIFAPLIADSVSMPSGKTELAVVAGINDDLFGLDAKTGKQLWHTHYESTFNQATAKSATLCPGGQTDVPVMAHGSQPGDYVIYAVAWDGRLHTINAADGKDMEAPAKFMPPNGKPYALNLLDNVIYTSTSQSCGGLTNATFAYDLKTKIATMFVPSGGGLWGRRGVAVSPDGVDYMGTGDGLWDVENGHLGNGIIAVKLDKNKDLQLVDYFAPKNAEYMFKRDLDVNVTPVLFDFKGKHLLVGSSKECRIWLLDRDNFGGDDRRTPLYQTPLLCNVNANFADEGVWGSINAWKDAKGDQYIGVPFYGPVATTFHAPIENGRPKVGGIATYKVEEKDGKWSLTPAWLSADIDHGEEAVVANGVMLTYASGEDARQQWDDPYWNKPTPPPAAGPWSAQSNTRISFSRHAVAYAMDASNGKILWSSGNQITTWNHFSGITAANGKIYIGTYDGSMYCFGVAK
jgi:outer membrane protein assembly factor BamB